MIELETVVWCFIMCNACFNGALLYLAILNRKDLKR